MPNHSATAIANEFLTRRADNAWPTQMQIQKLVYIAYGWNLAINEDVLIDEAPEAWDNGPVFRTIWDHIRDFGYKGDNCTLVNSSTKEVISANLTGCEEVIIDHVWKKYGTFYAHELSKMTHEPGTPWANAYLNHGRNALLDSEEIKNHYTELALAGRE